jgi:hypothetical protein
VTPNVTHKGKRRQDVLVPCKCCNRSLLQKEFLLITLLCTSSNSGLWFSGGIRLACTLSFLNYLHFRAKNAMSRTGWKFSISRRLFFWHKVTVAMKYFYMFQVIMRCALLRSSHTCDPVSRTGVRSNLTILRKHCGIFHLNLNARLLYSIFYFFWVSYTFNTQTTCLQPTVNPPPCPILFIYKHNTILCLKISPVTYYKKYEVFTTSVYVVYS